MDELIVLFMREFGWTFEYTWNLVRTLPLKHLNPLVKELQYQKAVEDYKTAANSARIVCTMASTKNHIYTIRDVIGSPPEREIQEDKLEDIAEKEGIKMPKEG